MIAVLLSPRNLTDAFSGILPNIYIRTHLRVATLSTPKMRPQNLEARPLMVADRQKSSFQITVHILLIALTRSSSFSLLPDPPLCLELCSREVAFVPVCY